MKYLIVVTMLIASNTYAYSSYNDKLECREVSRRGDHGDTIAVSCVSKASIEKDKAQLELIKLQIKKLKEENKAKEKVK